MSDRTEWKRARARVKALFSFDPDYPNPAGFGPAGGSKRFFQYFGGVDDHTIKAQSEERYWILLDKYVAGWTTEQARTSRDRKLQQARESMEKLLSRPRVTVR